ncbi:MAG TPA: TetR/AcrR family transcriptional regulator [Clostridiales bacterium]|jgi:AcrR family transcriptional regulator|nr:TetR/AcrR family transcriptional regulator [Clostridiales bacterium]
MPKQTFFNLSEEKRSKITSAALEEFSEYSFSKSSINRIVAKAGIPKGSFYQYFEDKLDLYRYILQLIADDKIKYIQQYTKELSSGDFFDYLKATYTSGIAFAIDHPIYAKIGIFLLKEDEKMQQTIYGDLLSTGEVYVKDMILKGQENGSIRKDISADFVAFIINKLNLASTEYLKSKTFDDTFYKNYESFSYSIIDLIKNGIKEDK